MLPLLVEACPSFSKHWEEHKAEYGDEEDYLPYVALGGFSGHVIALHRNHAIEEFARVFEIVERFHVEGEEYVREAATIGLLESIQNGLDRSDLEVFKGYLLPVSAKWWDQLNLFWTGKINYVGETCKQ